MPVGKDGICLEYMENHCETWECQLGKMEYVWNTWKNSGIAGKIPVGKTGIHFGIRGKPVKNVGISLEYMKNGIT